ncbi:Crp/Fnr family transcriptional regulator [Marinibacterium profundimaris]|uniref:Crp/Fnr family transcriptional regulator n=1 Tax=Marinibacterium profundimaris TaxID=1679460 RepID=UPI0013030796|nr:Crp/Fnr family transcriptional regulator [Marinibacterium profundimaris]
MTLPDGLSRQIMSSTRIVHAARGVRVYDHGEPPGGIYRVVSGVVAVMSWDETPLIGHLLGPGSWFGETSALTRQPRSVTTMALTEARLAYLPLPVIEEIADMQPDLWRGLAALSAANSMIAVQTAHDLMLTRPEDRVSAVLRRLGDSLGRDTPIPLSQEQLADMCVLSRGAVSRILSRLESAGKVRRGYREIWWLG